MTNSLIEALVFVLDVFTRLYLILLLLRFLMPWFGVNFDNPLAQGILKVTSPLVIPLRRLLPPIGKIDTATLVVAIAIQCLLTWVIAFLVSSPVTPVPLVVGAIFSLLSLTVTIFLYAILISVILSWIAPNNYNPAIGMISAICEPVLRPFRRVIPPMGGFDISPMFAMVALAVVLILIRGLRSEVLQSLT